MSTNLLSVIEQQQKALEHCVDAIVERGLNGSQEQARKWGLQLPLDRAYAALAAGQQALEQTQVEAVHKYNLELPDGDKRDARVWFSARTINNGVSTHDLCITVRDSATPSQVEPAPTGCAHCQNPLYAGTKCKNCGRVSEVAPSTAGEPEQASDWKTNTKSIA